MFDNEGHCCRRNGVHLFRWILDGESGIILWFLAEQLFAELIYIELVFRVLQSIFWSKQLVLLQPLFVFFLLPFQL
ncbi:hypothetical protein AUJ46_04545 [Candidatus Peregrinibacteria bacterium CG1_02_54_53]|nr:MAG: hypothetical protein AUJ46_04545 [Candidatus Peregrinibacteria bacterium CG1_02_54_53]